MMRIEVKNDLSWKPYGKHRRNIQSCDMLRRSDLYIVTDISEERSVCIFRVKQKEILLRKVGSYLSIWTA